MVSQLLFHNIDKSGQLGYSHMISSVYVLVITEVYLRAESETWMNFLNSSSLLTRTDEKYAVVADQVVL